MLNQTGGVGEKGDESRPEPLLIHYWRFEKYSCISNDLLSRRVAKTFSFSWKYVKQLCVLLLLLHAKFCIQSEPEIKSTSNHVTFNGMCYFKLYYVRT